MLLLLLLLLLFLPFHTVHGILKARIVKCLPFPSPVDHILSELSTSMKRQKDRTLKDELPRSVGAQYATGEE